MELLSLRNCIDKWNARRRASVLCFLGYDEGEFAVWSDGSGSGNGEGDRQADIRGIAVRRGGEWRSRQRGSRGVYTGKADTSTGEECTCESCGDLGVCCPCGGGCIVIDRDSGDGGRHGVGINAHDSTDDNMDIIEADAIQEADYHAFIVGHLRFVRIRFVYGSSAGIDLRLG